MRELVVNLLCDGEHPNRTPAVIEHTLIIDGGRPRIVACCEEHEVAIKTVQALMQRGMSPQAAAPRQGGQATGPQTCPQCGQVVKSRTGLGAHARRTHQMTLAELEEANSVDA